jgi:hypothetical protein
VELGYPYEEEVSTMGRRESKLTIRRVKPS